MRAAWFIQLRENYPSDQKIGYAALEQGMRVFMEPFEPDGMSYDFLPTDEPVIVYGSVALLQDLTERAGTLPFTPALWCDWPPFACRTFFDAWKPWLLQRRYELIPIGNMERRWDALVDEFGVKDRVFVRPDEGNKDFNGGVVRREFFKAWHVMATKFSPPPESLVVVATPERILAEYRLFVANGAVVTGSKYRTGDLICPEAGFPPPAADLAETAANAWAPAEFFCMDIAETPTGFRIVECNPFNCAGVYESDLRLLTAAAERVVID